MFFVFFFIFANPGCTPMGTEAPGPHPVPPTLIIPRQSDESMELLPFSRRFIVFASLVLPLWSIIPCCSSRSRKAKLCCVFRALKTAFHLHQHLASLAGTESEASLTLKRLLIGVGDFYSKKEVR